MFQQSSPTSRVHVAPVEGATELFSPAFAEYLVALHDRFGARVHELRARRAEVLRRAHAGTLPGSRPPGEIVRDDWKVPPVPEELLRPGIEISGPCSITRMFINALNSGPEGERAEGDLDDDEDSGGHRLVDTVRAAHNRVAAVRRELAMRWIRNYLDLNFRSLGSYTRAELARIAADDDAI